MASSRGVAVALFGVFVALATACESSIEIDASIEIPADVTALVSEPRPGRLYVEYRRDGRDSIELGLDLGRYCGRPEDPAVFEITLDDPTNCAALGTVRATLELDASDSGPCGIDTGDPLPRGRDAADALAIASAPVFVDGQFDGEFLGCGGQDAVDLVLAPVDPR